MKEKKNLIFTILALTLPLLYHLFNKIWYYIWFDMNLIDSLSTGLRTYLLTNALSFDAIFCFIMLWLTLPLYLKFHREDKMRIPKKYIKKLTLNDALKILIVTFGVAGISMGWQIFARVFLMDVDSLSKGVERFDKTFSSASTSHAYFWMFLSITLLGPIIEEIIFRGILFSSLNRFISGGWVVLITSLYFGLWHSNPIQIVYTTILGLILGLVYAATRNIFFPILIHLFNNFLSNLPPSLESNDIIIIGSLILRIIAIIPMIYIVYKMVKENPAFSYKIQYFKDR